MSGHPSPAVVLPHAYPFVLIDGILSYEEGLRAVCLKNVTVNEEFFTGHFRENPVMPGVLIIEAMAQAAGLLLSAAAPRGAMLSRVNDARLKRPVVPGDRLIITATLTHTFAPLSVFDCSVSVDETLAASAEITLAAL